MKVTKYIPVWNVSFKGKVYTPSRPGQSPKTIEGLPDDEIKRLLQMGAIAKIEFSDSSDDDDPGLTLDDVAGMSYNELRSYAATAGINTGPSPSKEDLLRLIGEAWGNDPQG